MPGPVSTEERAAILDLFKDGPGTGAPSTYSGGQAWAADVAARRTAAKAGQLDALRASIASSEVSIDTRPGSIYVQSGDSVSKIAARFPEYGSTNDLKNQLIAANPWLSDPNMLREGMELKFPGAGTAVDSAAMARAAGADARYQATLDVQTAQSQRERWDALQTGAWSGRTDPSGPVWNMRDASAAAALSREEWFRTATDAELHAAGYQTMRSYDPAANARAALESKRTLNNLAMAIAGPSVAAAVVVPATSTSIAATGAVYSAVGPWGSAGIGFVTAGGMDAGMQYHYSGTVRPAQTLFSGMVGAVSGPVGATSGLWTNIVASGAGAAVNAGFQNIYYGDNKSLVVPTLVGSAFGAGAHYAGAATTKGLSYFRPEIYYPKLNPQVPALFQQRAINIVPGAAGASVGGIAAGTAPVGENALNTLLLPPNRR